MKKKVMLTLATTAALLTVGYAGFRWTQDQAQVAQSISAVTTEAHVNDAQLTSTGVYTQAVSCFNQGAALSYKGNNRQAVPYFSRLIDLVPSAANYYNRGIVHALTGNYQAAIADFDEATALDPNLTVAYYFRGNVRYTLGDRRGAWIDYEQAVNLEPAQIDPQDEHGYFARGLARLHMGDMDGALSDMDSAATISRQHNNSTFMQDIAAAQSRILPGQDGTLDGLQRLSSSGSTRP